MGSHQKNINLFIVVLLITLVSLYVIKNYGNMVEAYTTLCAVQDEGSNFIDCYYKRLREGAYKQDFDKGNYKSEVYLIREPSEYNDENLSHRIGVMLFYLKYKQQFPRIGCGTGWVNKIDENANDVVSDWAYYIHRTMMDSEANENIVSGTDSNKTYSMTNLKYYNDNHSRVLKDTLVPSNSIASTYLAIKNKNTSTLDKNMFHVLMINFLAHYIHNATRTDYNAFYRWGVPVYKETRVNRGVVEKLNISPSTQAFNYYYNIRLENNEYLAYNESNNTYKFEVVTAAENLTNSKYLFRVFYSSDCGDYLKIQNAKSSGYLKVGDYANDTAKNTDLVNSSSEQDGSVFFFDYKHVDNDLTIDLNKLFIPLMAGQTDNHNARTGDYVTIMVKTNRSKAFLSYLVKGANGSAKVHRVLNPTEAQSSSMLTTGVNITGINCSTHNKFRFVRQGLFNPTKYVYKERLISDTNPAAPPGSKIDVGGVYEFLNDASGNGSLGQSEITNLRGVTTNQRVFPVYNDSDDANDCVYTGTQKTIRGIQNVCGIDGRCYGEYDSLNDSFKRIYVGPQCNLPIKKVERTGNSYDKKERRGAILCDSSGVTDLESTNSTKEIGSEAVKANICYQPKFSDNTQPGNALVHPRLADTPECRENRDYGMLSAPTLQMYVANDKCDADYKYYNDPLKSVGGERVCRPGTVCEFSNSIAPGERNYSFLNDNDLTVIKNQNISLKNELSQLDRKLSTYKQNMAKKEERSQEGEAVLLDELNESIFDRLNTNLMKLNQVTFDELQKK